MGDPALPVDLKHGASVEEPVLQVAALDDLEEEATFPPESAGVRSAAARRHGLSAAGSLRTPGA
jgi:hypothetical protein